ncbi:acyltransferase [Novosphingobium umbonatum]|uniref:Acyltransferase n=1 Tax=Novosphingobium umbonatum TaxID=1908524 RepID=A0A437N312_9SPHN|nr:acyltransferase family protein [Novosphingobium umbonatum]RVU04306.1 acyltransferase [Novosphingobium umbonatum]
MKYRKMGHASVDFIKSVMSKTLSSIEHRKDIDGLRCVAVMAVLLNHFTFGPTGGGFVGVDIFYVISGYLITGILQKEIDRSGTVSIIGFYERRARRIMPAFFATVMICLLYGYAVLMPSEYFLLGKQAIFSTMFVSNIFLYLTTDYFSDLSVTLPLLHTWSLAVEEQFYIFFPIVFLMMKRSCGKTTPLILWLLAILSLALSQWQVLNDKDAAFYLLPARAWELLVGSLLAVGAVPLVAARIWREMASATGFILIAIGVLMYDRNTPFPGVTALLPCLGTGLIIWSGSLRETTPTLVARALSVAPVQFVGLISYSLYIIHWPIVVFYRMQVHYSLNLMDKCILLISSITLATLLWRWVETPFRNKLLAGDRRGIFRFSCAGMAVTAAISGAVLLTKGAESRLTPEQVRIASYLDYDDTEQFRRGRCFITYREQFAKDYDRAHCLQPEPDRPNYVIFGDSHAADLWTGLNQVFPDKHFMQATVAGCSWNVYGVDRNCRELFDFFEKQWHPDQRIDGVILSFRWNPKLKDQIPRYVALARRLSGKVYYVGPSVEYNFSLPRVLVKSAMKNAPELVARDRAFMGALGPRERDEQIKSAVLTAGASYVSAYDALCPRDQCATLTSDRVPVQFDYGHLTSGGAILVAKAWKDGGTFP